MSIQNQVKNIAQQGRFGDSTLVHMAPSEVAGLAQMGQMTINPQTGLPEAFSLKDAIPIAASIVGGVFGGPVGAGLGSGLATGILEGDLKKGLMAGLTSYGLCKDIFLTFPLLLLIFYIFSKSLFYTFLFIFLQFRQVSYDIFILNELNFLFL